jgi:hypothetical protein
VGIGEEVADVPKIFTRNTEEVRTVHVADGEDDMRRVPLSIHEKAVGVAFDRCDSHAGLDLEVELQDDRSQIGQILLARGLRLIERLQGHAGDGDALR